MIEPQELSDRQEIVDLLVRYATAMDDRDWTLLDGVFSAGADCDYERVGGLRGPYPEIRTWMAAALEDCVSQHYVGNFVIQIDGDSATSRTYLHGQHIRGTGEACVFTTVGGIYTDELVRTADGWRICHRIMTRRWVASGSTGDVPS